MTKFNSFRQRVKTTHYRASERARWHRHQRIKRLQYRIVALGALETIINAVYTNAAIREATEERMVA